MLLHGKATYLIRSELILSDSTFCMERAVFNDGLNEVNRLAPDKGRKMLLHDYLQHEEKLPTTDKGMKV